MEFASQHNSHLVKEINIQPTVLKPPSFSWSASLHTSVRQLSYIYCKGGVFAKPTVRHFCSGSSATNMLIMQWQPELRPIRRTTNMLTMQWQSELSLIQGGQSPHLMHDRAPNSGRPIATPDALKKLLYDICVHLCMCIYYYACKPAAHDNYIYIYIYYQISVRVFGCLGSFGASWSFLGQ